MHKMSARRAARAPAYRRSHSALSRVCLLLGALLVLIPATGSAQVAVATAAPEQEPPSIFESGYQGLLAGTVVGAAGGYLVARKDDWQRKDWRKVGLGMGIGALSGAGLGIILGISDRAGAPGARYVARDLSLGAGFGLVVGAIGGGISAIAKKDGEHVLFGASIGVIAGAGLGIITGIIEGQTKRRRTNTTTTVSAGLSVRPSLDVSVGPDGSSGRTILPGLTGRF
jgi:hypothetical protein